MAALTTASQYIGNFLAGFTADQLQELQERAQALFPKSANALLQLARLGHMFPIELDVRATVSSATVNGGAHLAQIPFKVVKIQAGCETSGGSACTVDLHKDTGSGYATMLNADIDVHTTVGVGTAGDILNGAEDISVGDKLRLQVIATGGAVVGTRATLWCVRL
jgi:hypothetical protein